MIINSLPDLKTLHCLVLASPSYHAIYTNAREPILTEFTIRQLESRNINLFQPMGGLYLYHQKGDAATDGYIIDAVGACVKWTQRPKLFKLSVGFCLELLRVERAMLMSEEGFPLPDDEPSRRRFEDRTRGTMLELSIVIVDSQFSAHDYSKAGAAANGQQGDQTIFSSWQAY